ncbi:hypothetical protein FQN60_012109 [Etheostoma spectabile]|uniref:Uncharacterized protein n=1 Tax=Etheostoma spectabile TaxID=54343 RepID=A0A5J5DNC6_9PERO|nr:hypothetical protein FQN60_012109 [Etheostoma spectabile]
MNAERLVHSDGERSVCRWLGLGLCDDVLAGLTALVGGDWQHWQSPSSQTANEPVGQPASQTDRLQVSQFPIWLSYLDTQRTAENVISDYSSVLSYENNPKQKIAMRCPAPTLPATLLSASKVIVVSHVPVPRTPLCPPLAPIHTSCIIHLRHLSISFPTLQHQEQLVCLDCSQLSGWGGGVHRPFLSVCKLALFD